MLPDPVNTAIKVSVPDLLIGWIKVEAKEAHEEGIRDIQDSYELGMEELALRDEEANREALIRHEQIVGALEAQQKELEAMST